MEIYYAISIAIRDKWTNSSTVKTVDIYKNRADAEYSFEGVINDFILRHVNEEDVDFVKEDITIEQGYENIVVDMSNWTGEIATISISEVTPLDGLRRWPSLREQEDGK